MLNSKNAIIWVNIKKGTTLIKLPIAIPFLVIEEITHSLFDISDLIGLFTSKMLDFKKLLILFNELLCALTNEPLDLVTVKTPEADIIVKIR